ncbi:MAG: hypothetical protein O2962_09110, partial [Cyanobacteria bacterium]|nr:hypothetical protein [Cyanobacteriota bacterium]
MKKLTNLILAIIITMSTVLVSPIQAKRGKNPRKHNTHRELKLAVCKQPEQSYEPGQLLVTINNKSLVSSKLKLFSPKLFYKLQKDSSINYLKKSKADIEVET